MSLREFYDAHEGLSIDNALENTVTEELLEDVLHDYWEGIESSAVEIEDALAAEDYKLYTVKVHALKSSSRLVGIMGLGDEAYEYELTGYEAQKGDEDAIAKIKNGTADLLGKYRSYIDVFAPVFNG